MAALKKATATLVLGNSLGQLALRNRRAMPSAPIAAPSNKQCASLRLAVLSECVAQTALHPQGFFLKSPFRLRPN